MCPQRCSLNGECRAGRCQCHPGWRGETCASRDKMVQMSSLLLDDLLAGHNKMEGEVTIFYPLYMVALVAIILLSAVCIFGYLLNLWRGARGAAAIPYFQYATASFTLSDYQLKQPM